MNLNASNNLNASKPVSFQEISPHQPEFLEQFSFRSRYTSHSEQVDLVLTLARLNITEAIKSGQLVEPFAAVVFDQEGLIKSVGLDSAGDRGHEVNNALIGARPAILGHRHGETYTLVTFSPPCRRCFEHIRSLQPDRVISIIYHQDLVANFPQIDRADLAPVDWQAKLNGEGILALHSKYRSRGMALLDLVRYTAHE